MINVIRHEGPDLGSYRYVPNLEWSCNWGVKCDRAECVALAMVVRPDGQLINQNRSRALFLQNGWLRLALGRYLCPLHSGQLSFPPPNPPEEEVPPRPKEVP